MPTDHLWSTRLVTDKLGGEAPEDYGAFGDETATAERVSVLGYNAEGATRKNYTGYEEDAESSLEFAQARYYSTTHGRYTSVDPLTASDSLLPDIMVGLSLHDLGRSLDAESPKRLWTSEVGTESSGSRLGSV